MSIVDILIKIKDSAKKIVKLLVEPILEDGVPSMGRILLALTFLGCWVFWGRGLMLGTVIDLPDSLWNTLVLFAGYVFGGKGLESISNIASIIKGKKQDE